MCRWAFCAFFSFLSLISPLSAKVERSVVPLLNQPRTDLLDGRINHSQHKEIQDALSKTLERLRVMSFNMLMNRSAVESKLDEQNRWHHRRNRIREYIYYAKPDIIGSQELYHTQLRQLSSKIRGLYDYYGVGRRDGEKQGEIEAIFYRKNRLELLESSTYFTGEKGPAEPGPDAFGQKNAFTVCRFKDKQTSKELLVVNCHLAFKRIESRAHEAELLASLVESQATDLPVIVLGDFNTFSFRQELDLPAYDGNWIERTITTGRLQNSRDTAALGHFGPVSSTNYSEELGETFAGDGTPGIILDHIFCTPNVTVIVHGIDPLKVDGFYPSDHFPVIADIALP